MAGPRARILECLALFRDKLPVIALGMECEFQHSKGVSVPNFTVGLGGSDGPVRVLTSAANYELANAVLYVCFSVGVLGREALVVMVIESLKRLNLQDAITPTQMIDQSTYLIHGQTPWNGIAFSFALSLVLSAWAWKVTVARDF